MPLPYKLNILLHRENQKLNSRDVSWSVSLSTRSVSNSILNLNKKKMRENNSYKSISWFVTFLADQVSKLIYNRRNFNSTSRYIVKTHRLCAKEYFISHTQREMIKSEKYSIKQRRTAYMIDKWSSPY